MEAITSSSPPTTTTTKEETDTQAVPSIKPQEEKDENKNDTGTGKTSSEPSKRFIPEHKKPDAALTFPEKMMSLMNFAVKHDEETFCVAWLSDGKSFVIRNPDEFTRKVLPKYFKATKFSSFTRKLYRWGFRQVNRGIGPDDPIIFGNEYFQRDNLELMTKMRSITAASGRKQEQVVAVGADMRGNIMSSQKRSLDVVTNGQHQHLENNKRVLLDQIMQQKVLNMSMAQNQVPQIFGQGNGGNGASMSLAAAMRPNMSVGGGMNGLKPLDMFSQSLQPQHPNPLFSAFPALAQQQPPPNMAANNSSQFNNPTSTVDIVNAAINALRYAS